MSNPLASPFGSNYVARKSLDTAPLDKLPVKVYPGIFSAAHGCPILTVYAVKPVVSQFSLMVARLASLGLRNR